MPPSTSSRKRPALQSSIQPSITSFFNSSPAPTSGSVTWSTPHTNPTEPPPFVKSGLLNVGMRIRKAVPEGLKSGTYKAQKFALSVSPTQDNVLPHPTSPRKNKREYEDETFPSTTDIKREQPVEQIRQIAVPKSLTRKYHAAVPRSAVSRDTVMQDQCSEEDFEEAGFLQPVS